MKKKLQLSALFGLLRSAASHFPDKRKGKNIRYSLQTFAMTAFSAFFMQCPSFNSHKVLTDRLGKNGNAGKRWTDDFRRRHKKVSATLLGDDLYSRQPMCEKVLENRFNFIFVCKPSSHPTLYEWVDMLEKGGDLKTKTVRRWNGRYHENDIYKYANDVPLRGGDDALTVNWAEHTTVSVPLS